MQYQGKFGFTRPLLPMVRPLLIAITHLMLVLIPSGIRAVSTHPLCLNSDARLKLTENVTSINFQNKSILSTIYIKANNCGIIAL